DPNITTYTDLDLPYGTYLYGVSSLYSNGESETATVNVVLSPAEPPQNVQVVEVYPASLISWEAPASRSLQNYQVWRLMAGNEDMEESWTFIGTAGETQYYFWDQDWHLLEAGAYRYAVKALYDNNQSSLPGFSNILTKSAQTLVYGRVLDSDTNAAISGARIAVQGYEAFSDATGNYQLDLAPGTYQLTCFKDGYRVKYQHSITVGASQGLALNLVLDENLLMPNSLSVSANPNQPEAGVELSWNVPTAAGTSWINYDKEATGRSIGTNSQADLDVAIRFPAAMLAQYAGSSLRSVRVLPNAEGEFSIRVWTGGNATAPGIMVVDQPFTPLIGAYNTIELENPVYIQGNEELWIGYRCNVPGGYPAGCDNGPLVYGAGDKIFFNGSWYSLTELDSGLAYNWNIQGLIDTSAQALAGRNQVLAPIARHVEEHRPCTGALRVNPDSAKLEMNEDLANRHLIGYDVYRLQADFIYNPSAWQTLISNQAGNTYTDQYLNTIEPGYFRWAVRTNYSSGNSPYALSEALYLDNPTAMISIDQNFFSSSLLSGTTDSRQLTITNEGNAELEFSLQASNRTSAADMPELGRNGAADWLSFSQDSGTVAPGASCVLDITFDSEDMVLGAYERHYTIINNSENAPEIALNFHLNVVQPNLTTIDNENNNLSGYPDNDLNTMVYANSAKHPIEFNIFVTETGIESALLKLNARNQGYLGSQSNKVYINGHYLGDLINNQGQWQDTMFLVNTAWIQPAPFGKNLVQVQVDANHPNLAINVRQGELIFNESMIYTSVESVSLDQDYYTLGGNLAITQKFKSNLSNHAVRVNTNILNPDGDIVASSTEHYTIYGYQQTPYTTNIQLPAEGNLGAYQVETLVYDALSDELQDTHYTPFEVVPAHGSIYLVETAMDFGSVYARINHSKYLQIQNHGSQALELQFTPAHSAINLLPPQMQIAPFGNATLRVNLLNVEPGIFDSSFRIISNDPEQPEIDIAITAVFIEPPDLVLGSYSLELFGVAGQAVQKSITLSNPGSEPLNWQA
ncbi:MAG: carboxypeptidase regulatory-like domain-containing protein, partial [Candidatus Cloacimonadaceae bacterium]